MIRGYLHIKKETDLSLINALSFYYIPNVQHTMQRGYAKCSSILNDKLGKYNNLKNESII